jgi:outer membrane receptor for ferrienterochelin and colicins
MLLRRPVGPLFALWLALFALAPPAHAEGNADEADLAFSLGNEAYARGDFKEALRSYFLSYRLVPNRNVLFNIARCYEALERFDQAYRHYHDLSKEELSESDRREVSRSLARIRPKVALVRVETEPAGAEVYADRVDLGSRGKTPQTLALTPGRHKLTVHKEGHREAESFVELVRGKEAVRRFELERVLGRVRLTGSPRGAWVKDAPDGPSLGSLPVAVALSPGRRLLYVGMDGFLTAQFLVDVPPDGEVAVPVALGAAPRPTGKVVVTATRENALIRVDGVDSGFTPAVLSLAEGEHQVEVSYEELRPYRTRVLVEPGGESRVHAELVYGPPAVVAASKSLTSVDEAAASTTVLTREELRAFGYTTLAEALASLRGVFISDDRQYQYLGIRGFSPPGDLNTRVLILWDGHPMNDVWSGQGYVGRDLSVDLDDVERIEVVRGPGSSLYGTGAFFAVINVVPRASLGPRRNAEAVGGVGALGSWRARAAAGATGEGDSVLLSGSAFGAEGAAFTDLGALGRVYGLDSERAYSAMVRGQVGEVSVLARLNQRNKEIPTAPFGTALGAEGTRQADSRGFVEARFDRALPEGGQLSGRASYDGMRYRAFWVYPPEVEDGRAVVYTEAASADWIGAETRYRTRVVEGNHLTVGAEVQLQLKVAQEAFATGAPVPLEPRSRTLLSVYALDEWRLHPRLSLSAGMRVDKYLDLAATPLSPRLALIGRPYPGGLSKAVVGQAFRAPNIYELYYTDNGLSQRAALSLAPEAITTFEVEHAHDLTREVRLTASGYHNRISRLIVLERDGGEAQCGSPSGSEACLAFANSHGLLRAFGAEAEVRWQAGRNALFNASYSFVNLVGADEHALAGTPNHLVSFRWLSPLAEPFVRLALEATYQSLRRSERVPDGSGEALLLSFGLSGEAGRVRYFAGVQNLLDARYGLPVSSEFAAEVVPQYGRTFRLQLSASY